MSEAVWKYELPSSPVRGFPVEMPLNSTILCVQAQARHKLCVWAMVDPDIAISGRRYFNVVHTGDIEHKGLGRYLGTAQFAAGSYVLHVFEALK